MIEKRNYQRLKMLWPVFIISGAVMSAAFLIDWIGLSEPDSLSSGQILLVGVGLLILLIGILGRKTIVFYRSVAILLLNTIVLIICLEMTAAVILRVVDLFPTAPAPEMEVSYYKSQDWAAQYWVEYSEKIDYSPWVIWRRRPFEGKTINIDPVGIRQTPGSDCAPGAYKVFTFGGSTLWGTGAPDWATIPAYLQTELKPIRAEAVCIINFGEIAYVSTQSMIELVRQLQGGNVPDLVMFYDGSNDVVAAYASGQPGVHHNLKQVAARLMNSNQKSPLVNALERSYLFSLATYLIPQEQISKTRLDVNYRTMGIDPDNLAISVAQVYLTNYHIVDALAQQYEFEYQFFWHPHISIGRKSLTEEERIFRSQLDPAIIELYEAVYRKIEQASSEQENLHYIADSFDEEKRSIWIDHVHVTPVGNQLVAQRIMDVIKHSQ